MTAKILRPPTVATVEGLGESTELYAVKLTTTISFRNVKACGHPTRPHQRLALHVPRLGEQAVLICATCWRGMQAREAFEVVRSRFHALFVQLRPQLIEAGGAFDGLVAVAFAQSMVMKGGGRDA